MYIEFIVSDDDSTMRAYLQHKCNNIKEKLPDDIPEPNFLTNYSHRIKVTTAPVFAMMTTTKYPSKYKRRGLRRIKY